MIRIPFGRFIANNERDTVRLLLLNPDSPNIDRWLQKDTDAARVRSDIAKTLTLLGAQVRMGRKIDVRLYSFTPPMRIQIVDDERAYICEYTPRWSDGWDAPQFCFVRQCERPFVRCLRVLFDHLWQQGSPVDWKQYVNSPEGPVRVAGS